MTEQALDRQCPRCPNKVTVTFDDFITGYCYNCDYSWKIGGTASTRSKKSKIKIQKQKKQAEQALLEQVTGEQSPFPKYVRHIYCITPLDVFLRFEENIIASNNMKWKSFHRNGYTCMHCNLRGQFVIVFGGRTAEFCYGLFGLNEHGKYIELTLDHIIPRSRGGSNSLANSQTLCSTCNVAKGSSHTH